MIANIDIFLENTNPLRKVSLKNQKKTPDNRRIIIFV